MCGISGFAGEGGREDLRRMSDSLFHRGPEESGESFVPHEYGLGFRRLAIIDLATGSQPLANEDGSIISVFNGEIYNYQELRQRISARHKLHTSGDAEIIPHLYEEEGVDSFRHYNGMFAVAIWDRKKRTLILARDRFGKKPLYYMRMGKMVIFGSEVKAILAHSLAKRELDLESMHFYLTHEYVPAPQTIFKHIYKVMPGTALSFSESGMREHCYYRPSFDVDRSITFPEALRRFDELLTDSVRLRMISDVPLGAFLSGGLDSSTVCYYMQKALDRPLQTFSIAFPEASFDESAYARRVARHLGTEHHESTFDSAVMLGLLEELGPLADEPLGDAALFPNYALAKFTKRRVTVAVGGDAGDELLMGYPTFQAARLARWYAKLPEGLRKSSIEPFIERLPTSFSHISLDYRLKRFVLGIREAPHRRNLLWIGSFTPEEKKALLSPEVRSELKDVNDFRFVDALSNRSLTEEYLTTYLADDILMLKDRASMYTALELRAPLLDYRVVDFANSLPDEFKMRGFTTKYLLKKLMAGRLPQHIINRRKKGFGVPIADWLRGPLQPFMEELLSKERIRSQGLFNERYVEQLKSEHLSGKKDNHKPLWTLLMFEWWHQNWIAQQ